MVISASLLRGNGTVMFMCGIYFHSESIVGNKLGQDIKYDVVWSSFLLDVCVQNIKLFSKIY